MPRFVMSNGGPVSYLNEVCRQSERRFFGPVCPLANPDTWVEQGVVIERSL